MPYSIQKRKDKFCVIKDDTGETKKCYSSKEKALAYMRALYFFSHDTKYVKAAGDMELEVLGNPYFGPHNGKDTDGEYFSPETNFHADKFGLPPVVYYHGMDDTGHPTGSPQYIGKTVSYEDRPEGRWYRVILDKTSELAQKVWEAAKQGLAFASSGSIQHLVRVARDGLIKEWPVAELSIFDTFGNKQPANSYAVALPIMKSVYQQAGLSMPEGFDLESLETSLEEAVDDCLDCPPQKNPIRGVKTMGDKTYSEADVLREKEKAAEEARKSLLEEQEAARKAAEEKQAEIDLAVKAEREKLEAEFEEKAKKMEEDAIKNNRLPDNPDGGPYLTKFADLAKYSNLTAEDQAVLIGILDATDGTTQMQHKRSSLAAKQALAIKLEEDDSPQMEQARWAFKAEKQKRGHGAMKADEIQQQDLTAYGDEFVGVAYSNALWESIRIGTFVADKIPKIEVPAGHESIVIPVEGGDPTFYKVAEAEDTAASGWPNATTTSSRAGTTSKTLSLSKMGARMLYSGELEEDSIIPWVNYIRTKLQVSGQENLEHVVIDGDSATAASTNINDIGDSSAQAGTEVYLLFDGFRKSCLVTTTANSRSGGAITDTDFLETIKLMGTAGINAMDIQKCAFIQDANVRWKTLEISEVKTRDVFSRPTIENGMLTGIWGYPVYTSAQMHKSSSNRKVNTAGKVDQTTTSNNTTGSILAVRWDQWLLGYRRRMTLETTRIARADTTEIVALMRLGLAQRDTEASAISYNLTV